MHSLLSIMISSFRFKVRDMWLFILPECLKAIVGLLISLISILSCLRKWGRLKRPWCWEGLGAGGEGDDRGWDGWMASPTRWAWVWVNSGSWWWAGRPGVLRFMGSQRVGHDWATELNWTEERERDRQQWPVGGAVRIGGAVRTHTTFID